MRDSRQLTSLLDEVRLLACLESPLLVHLDTWWQSRQRLYIALDLAGLDLPLDCLQEGLRYPAELCRTLAAQLVLALQYLHCVGVLHRWCTVVYCTVVYCTVLYCGVPYCTVVFCTVHWCTVVYRTVLYCTTRCITLQGPQARDGAARLQGEAAPHLSLPGQETAGGRKDSNSVWQVGRWTGGQGAGGQVGRWTGGQVEGS